MMGIHFPSPDRLRRIGLGRHGFGHFSVFLRRETFFRWCHRRTEETETGDDDTGFHGNFSGLVLQSVCVCLGQTGSYDGCPYGLFLGTGYADSHYVAGTLDRDEGGGGCRGCPEKNGGTASLATAHLVSGDGKSVDVAIGNLGIGDKVVVRAGEKIPADGTVVSGSSTVNESMVTGEAKAVPVFAGKKVIGGSINGSGTGCALEVTGTGESGYLAQVMKPPGQ